MLASMLSAFRALRTSTKRPARTNHSRRLGVEVLEDRLALSGVPAAPVFTAATYSSSQVNLKWQPASGATSYQIEYVANGAWHQIGNYGSGTTGVSVTGLSANTSYEFDVVATNSAGSHWGTQQYATTALNIDHPAVASGVTYSLVNAPLFGANGPSFTDVRQGAVGDCWLESSLAEVAARNPSDIRNMFTYAGTTVENGVTVGLYNVRLYNTAGQARYYLVDTELPNGGNYYDHSNGVLWVALAEKAYVEANGANQVMTQHRGSDAYSALDGGYGTWGLQAITGRTASYYSSNNFSNLGSVMNAGEFVVLGTSATHASTYIVGSPSEGTHAYAVVGYNPNSSTPFEVYNPWGTDSSGFWASGKDQGRTVYGLFWANAAFLSQNFANQSIGTGSEADAGDAGAGAGEAASTAPVGMATATDIAWANGTMTQDFAAKTTGRANTATAAALTLEIALANYGVTGKTSLADDSNGHAEGKSSSDVLWMDAGSPASSNFMADSLFGLRIA
jgi:hypothetical protein